jgi:prephenate dehydratase
LSSEQVNVPKQKTKTLSLTPSKTHYRCKLICNSRDEANVLAKLIQSLKDRKLLLTSLHSEHMIDSANDETQDLAITADFIAFNSDPNQLESLLQLVRQIEEKAKIEIID